MNKLFDILRHDSDQSHFDPIQPVKVFFRIVEVRKVDGGSVFVCLVLKASHYSGFGEDHAGLGWLVYEVLQKVVIDDGLSDFQALAHVRLKD